MSLPSPPFRDEFVAFLIFDKLAMFDENIRQLRITADKLLALERINQVLISILFKSLFHYKLLLNPSY